MNNIFERTACVGILGGTFNPVHVGHVMLADMTVRQYADIERLVFMPNNLPAYKNSHEIIDEKHRVNMLKLATDGKDYSDISLMEIERGGITYTVDTLKEIKKLNPDINIYFIIGADSLFDLHKWKDYKSIMSMCTILAARRDSDYDKMAEYVKTLTRQTGFGRIEFIDAPEIDAASSQIRDSIAAGSIPYELLPDGVAGYIKDNKLYGWRNICNDEPG